MMLKTDTDSSGIKHYFVLEVGQRKEEPEPAGDVPFLEEKRAAGLGRFAGFYLARQAVQNLPYLFKPAGGPPGCFTCRPGRPSEGLRRALEARWGA